MSLKTPYDIVGETSGHSNESLQNQGHKIELVTNKTRYIYLSELILKTKKDLLIFIILTFK